MHDEEVMEATGCCFGLPQGRYLYLVMHGSDELTNQTYSFKQLVIVSETSDGNRSGWRNQALMVPRLGQIAGFGSGNASVDVML